MAGLLDFSQYDDPASAGRLAFGSTMLGMGGPSRMPVSVGQALAAAIGEGRQASTVAGESQRRNKLTDLQMMRAQLELEQFLKAQQEQQAAIQLMQQHTQTPGQQAASLPGGPTNFNAARIPQMPGGFNPDAMQQAAMRSGNLTAIGLADKLRPPPVAPFKLGADEVAYNPRTGAEMFRGMPKPVDPNKPFSVVDGKVVPNTAYQQYELEKQRQGRAQTTVSVNTGQHGFTNELKLRDEFKQEPIYKAHTTISQAYSQIKGALAEASPAGDLAAATKFMKMLDEGSVVRETELKMALSATGVLDRLVNYANMRVNGTFLTPSQRIDFRNLADRFYSESQKFYNAKQDEYREMARAYNLDADRALGRRGATPAGVPPMRSTDELIDFLTNPSFSPPGQ